MIPDDLRVAGFLDARRALSFLEELPAGQSWVGDLSASADPDQALLQAVRLREADPGLVDALSRDERARRRVCAILGGSQWLGDYVIADPARAAAINEDPGDPREVLYEAVGVRTVGRGVWVAAREATADDLRAAYRRVLLHLAADDLTSGTPEDIMPSVGARIADLVDATLDAGLALARRDVDPEGSVPFAIIAMGKTGARELNYISDVDVIYVAEAGEDGDERSALEKATRLASATASACSGPGTQAPLWTVDANLRPEGRNGVLVRTIESYRQYWDKWAQTWEFQALLKARACAGDPELGRAFEEAAQPYVWSASAREGFVEAARAMRRRVEDNISRSHASHELKLGRGGLRDVEFTVQLLQLVHGRTDAFLRVRSTLDAIEALREGGYIARSDADQLSSCYRLLRAVEHRTQLPRMRRNHLIPDKDSDLRVLGRAMDPVRYPDADAIRSAIDDVRADVRALHEDVFYRPIIAATASLSADEASLHAEGARDRLAAIGYRDPVGALTHIAALTQGTSRRAAIQRHLLPVFISWLANGADPDMGLLNFRVLSEDIGESHWYLALLRDSGVAARRLMTMLPNSRWIADALAKRPEAVAWLDDDAELAPREPQRLTREVAALIDRHEDATEAAARVRAVRTRELTRAAMSDLLGGVDPRGHAIADATDAALLGALAIAGREEAERWGSERAHVTFVAMGRYGGRECSYASDADVIALHEPVGGASDSEAAASATAIVNRVKKLLGSATSQLGIVVDLDLRPEGKNGPMSRTIASHEEYAQRWASTWERQAAVRARPIGSSDLDERARALFESMAYREVSESEVRDIRLLKARMENERLPRGSEPARHVKLGPGGLSDVEWTIQLIQMRHGARLPALRTPSTTQAIAVARDAGLLAAPDAEILLNAWDLATRIRAGNTLATGRMSGVKLDVVPRDSAELSALAAILGYGSGGLTALEEDWLRAARQARNVMERAFWEQQ
mgnify:FL=1